MQNGHAQTRQIRTVPAASQPAAPCRALGRPVRFRKAAVSPQRSDALFACTLQQGSPQRSCATQAMPQWAAAAMAAEKPLKIVFVSAEVAPWSKTGGLGDVAGALPRACVHACSTQRVVQAPPLPPSPQTLAQPLSRIIDVMIGFKETRKHLARGRCIQ